MGHGMLRVQNRGLCMSSLILIGKGLNESGWERVVPVIEANACSWQITENHQVIKGDFDLGVLLGYNKIVPEDVLNIPRYGFILFHSSNLPKGRGWAPIYNTIVRELPLVQTLLFVTPDVDSGNIIAKAKYLLQGNETEREVRMIDDLMTLCLLEESLKPLLRGEITGISQNENDATWWRRRAPEDSVVDLNRALIELVDHLRALPKSAPAFFDYKGRRFYLTVKPADGTREIDKNKITIDRFY